MVARSLASELLHLPDKPAGVGSRHGCPVPSFRTSSPAGQAGRGRVETWLPAPYLPPFFTCRTSRQGSGPDIVARSLASELLHLPDKPAGVASRHGCPVL